MGQDQSPVESSVREESRQVDVPITFDPPLLTTCSPQFTGAILNLTAYYVLGIPLGLYLAFACEHGLGGLWEGLTLALVYTSGVGIWVGVRGVDWEAEVTKAQGRIGGMNEDE